MFLATAIVFVYLIGYQNYEVSIEWIYPLIAMEVVFDTLLVYGMREESDSKLSDANRDGVPASISR